VSRRYPVLTSALAVLLFSLPIAGCGGDDSGEASLTKAQFAKQADLICSDAANEQAKKAMLYLKKHPNAGEAEMMGPVAVPPLEKELGELQELGLPRGQEAEAEAFIEEFEKALGEFKEDPEAALSPGGNPFEKANRLAEKYEYGDCSQSP
jgi:hypothetical protein